MLLPPPVTLDSLVNDYPYLMCDLWGVLHDGLKAFPDAVAALSAARRHGARVIFVSNSPQRERVVRALLQRLSVGSDAFDGLITSGELARSYMVENFKKQAFFHLGPHLDRRTIEDVPLHEVAHPEAADVILATGLAFQTVNAHEPFLQKAAARNIPMLCANPDRLVYHAGAFAICAGAIADLYEVMGGPVVWLGKPASPPYEACLRQFSALTGQDVRPGQMLMIGDSLVTDVSGAIEAGAKSLFIESGIHRHEIDEEGLCAVMGRYGVQPDYRSSHLSWGAV